MLEVTVEIIDSVVEVTATFPNVGIIASGIDEGNSTTTYTNQVIDI